MLEYFLIWFACALLGAWNAAAARKSVLTRNLPYSDRGLLSFPTRMALASAGLVACQSAFVIRLNSEADFRLQWFSSLPGYFLTPVALVLIVIDARWHLLPNRVVLPATGVLLPLLSAIAIDRGDWEALLRVWAWGLGMGILLLLVSCFGLGMGDVKLGIPLAAWLGLYSWVAPVIMLFLASLLGGLFALTRLLARKATLQSHLAFGSWMIAGAYLTWFMYLPIVMRL
ncbi:prepilin peptidase [Mobiluncus mulieris]|uniref:Prepilin peptidase n=1 Tax=Mobiluncus mulieris TaxID=2052 RepID=A0A7Y0UU13_9ACTO|nr:prepilin peptidase [Mobiluncus mulieris]